jgi:hypothetical protein
MEITQEGAHIQKLGQEEESARSAVSWGAIAAGAFIASAMAFSLVALGAGLGLSAISPWHRATASGIGFATVAWLVIMQVVSGSLGAYVAGRLRTRWVSVHDDEVFFRDTAHGFLVWAVGTVLTAAFLTSAAAGLAGIGLRAGAAAVTGAAGSAASSNTTTASNEMRDYTADLLLRNAAGNAVVGNTGSVSISMSGQDGGAARSEIARIFAVNANRADFAPADKAYLAQLIVARTGTSQADADQRVAAAIAQWQDAQTKAREAADAARKVTAETSLWIFLSLLIGAFCASYAGTIGGRQRDSWALRRA